MLEFRPHASVWLCLCVQRNVIFRPHSVNYDTHNCKKMLFLSITTFGSCQNCGILGPKFSNEMMDGYIIHAAKWPWALCCSNDMRNGFYKICLPKVVSSVQRRSQCLVTHNTLVSSSTSSQERLDGDLLQLRTFSKKFHSKPRWVGEMPPCEICLSPLHNLRWCWLSHSLSCFNLDWTGRTGYSSFMTSQKWSNPTKVWSLYWEPPKNKPGLDRTVKASCEERGEPLYLGFLCGQ